MKSEIQNVFTVTHLPDDPPAGEIRTIASIASDGETIVPKSREFLMFVCFEVRGTNLDGQQVNPLLRSFRKQLENFRLKEGEMKAWPIRVDEFQSELIDSTCVLCSQNIHWNIYNPFWCHDCIFNLLHSLLIIIVKYWLLGKELCVRKPC